MVDLDTPLGEQFLDIAVGQPEAQVPAHRQHNDIGWEAEAGEGTVLREQDEGGEFSYRQSGCSDADAADATVPGHLPGHDPAAAPAPHPAMSFSDTL